MQISNGIASGEQTMSERITDVAEKLSTPAAYTASATTFGVGIINWNMVAIIVGILGTILTLAMNWYFGRRRLEIEERDKQMRLDMEEREHQARMKQYDMAKK